MLEKPFNTDNIRTRINKIISLYLSSNNLQTLLVNNKKDITGIESDVKLIIGKIVENIISNNYSIRLKKMASIVSTSLQNNYPNYNLDNKYIDAIVTGIPFYNIGAIAIKDDTVITRNSMKEEIEYGKKIASFVIEDNFSLEIAKNIIMYSCEMYNGSGYPEGIKGESIPIEAQITNLIVRLCSGSKPVQTLIKNINEEGNGKYNPDLIDIINLEKKELKKI